MATIIGWGSLGNCEKLIVPKRHLKLLELISVSFQIRQWIGGCQQAKLRDREDGELDILR